MQCNAYNILIKNRERFHQPNNLIFVGLDRVIPVLISGRFNKRSKSGANGCNMQYARVYSEFSDLIDVFS